MTPDPDTDWMTTTFYVRNGQALSWWLWCGAAVREAEALDEIGQALQVAWTERW